MKAKFTSTKVKYYSRLIDKYINVIYELISEKNDLENWEEQILIESRKENFSLGKDQHFLKVKLEEEYKEGNIISCIYTGVENDTLLARIA